MSNTIRITKEFSFEMAHALHQYPGKCARIHGHSYHLTVTVLGKTIISQGDPNEGMVMDFSVLKKIVQEEVIGLFDHALVLKETDPLLGLLDGGTPDIPQQNMVKTTYQPTCENLLIDFASRLQQRIPAPLLLHSMTLRETPTSYASWFAADNA